MQQFTVPQFIDVEDKIIGPLAVRQFIILLIGGGLIFIAYKFFDFSLFLFSSIIIAVTSFVFAFIKINGAPFHYFLLNLLQTMRRTRVRVWNKLDNEPLDVGAEEKMSVAPGPVAPEKISASRLNQLSLVVDTLGYYSGEGEERPLTIKENTIEDLLK